MDNPNLRQDGQAFSLTAQSLSSAEKEYYTVLWQAACVEGDLLRGKAAFDFLSKSQLPREILKRIWDIADWQKRGLGWQEFVVTLKLISAAQKKQLVSLERVLETSGPTSRDLPTFDGIAAPPDGDAPEVPQKRDVFAEFEALAGVATSGTAPSLEVLQVSPPTELVQEVEEPANHTGGNTSSSPPEVAHNDSQWDAFETPVWPEGASHGASAVPASAAPAHESQNWQAVGQTETAQKWDAFGDVQRQTENIHPEAAKETARPETDQEKWAAFGEDEAQASKPARVEWNAFESEPATQQESWSAFGNEVQPTSKPEEESWAAFESASAPTSATAATASTTASTTAPTGDLWSKMSAFDDLLKEDDPVGAGGSAEMEQVPASASVDPETERPETTELKFPAGDADDEDDEFGDFAAGPSSSPEVTGDPIFSGVQGTEGTHVENVDFLDFSPTVPASASTLPSTAPVGSADVVNDFATAVVGEGPKPASPSFAAFDADFGEFGGEAPAKAEPTGLLDLGGEFGDFGGSGGSTTTDVAALPAVPALASSNTALADVWAAFPEQGPASASEPQQSSSGETWNAFGDGGSGAPQGDGGEGWASFGTFDFPAQPASGGAPDPGEKADLKPSLSPIVFDEAPKTGNMPEPFFTEDEPEDGGSEAVEARTLARSLCSLGRFEEALQCKANGDVLRRLHAAEEKKKEAVAQDDFEGAIQIRSEIKEISNSLVSEEVLEVWRNLARGERDASLQTAAEQLRQRCQWMDGFSSAALGVAVGNFRRACPEHRANCLPVLPSLVRQQRRARQMYRAIEAISSQNVLLFLQVIFACIKTLCELLVESSIQMSQLTDPDWSDEERQCVHESDELQSLLRGLSGLRRLLWRLGLAAELFLPEGEGPDGPDAAMLQELQTSIASSLAKAKASWAKLESDIISLRLKIEPWQEGSTFEAGGCTNGNVLEQQRTAPLCRLCLLPAVPLGMEAEIEERDPGAVSAPWRGGHWHVQCANFWLRHASCSKAFKDLKVEDPFEDHSDGSINI